MPLNRRKGLRRLAAATLIPWCGGWAFWGWLGYQNVLFAERESANYEGLPPNFYNEMNAAGMRMIENSVIYGVFVPLAALLVIAAAIWVYRGFHA